MRRLFLFLVLSLHFSIFAESDSILSKKLDTIQIPQVAFFASPLPDAIMELQRLSKLHDLTEPSPAKKGIQFFYKSKGSDPPKNVTITLAPNKLGNAVRFISEMTNSYYWVEDDRVVISNFPKGFGENPLRTEFFELTQRTINRMVGIVRPNADPFAAPPPNNTNDVGVRLKDFLESNGVLFASAMGHRFAFDGFQIIVTHDDQNLKKISSILRSHDLDTPAQISIKLLLFEAPSGTLGIAGRNLKLSKKDTNKYPIIQNEIAEKLTKEMLSLGAKKLHTPSLLVKEGQSTSTISGRKYFSHSKSDLTQKTDQPDDKEGDYKQLGLRVELLPKVEKYQVVSLKLSMSFSRLMDEKILPSGEKEPVIWTTSNDTSILIGTDETFISLTTSSEEKHELITFLNADIKR